MIFVSGVHGVGKSYFCNRVKKELQIETYSASQLIEYGKQVVFAGDKLISDIEDNQRCLIEAVQKLKDKHACFLLDGHFCLLNKDGAVERISLDTFLNLQPKAIVLLTETPEVIAKRRKERDGIEIDIEAISAFQREEVCYAREVSQILKVDMKVSEGTKDIDATLSFIKSVLTGECYGW